jgi:uncharacterized protein (TIGR03435 family)
MERVSLLLVLSVLALPIHAQTQAMAPAFDAASIQVHKAGGGEEPRNGPWIQTSPGGITMRNAKLVWCLGWAYDQKEWLISGPDWIGSERYDIVAKAAGPVPVIQLKRMLQTLLNDRFKLVLHHEMKEFPVSLLVLGKTGPKNLQPAAASGPPDGPRPIGGKQFHSLAYKSVAMPDFAERLGAPVPLGVGERVVDGTGLAGVFDITVNIDTENFAGGPEEFADFLKNALERQFGLKLERRKMALDTLVVDRGNRTPTDN